MISWEAVCMCDGPEATPEAFGGPDDFPIIVGFRCGLCGKDYAEVVSTNYSRPTYAEQDPGYRSAMRDAGRGHLLP